MEGCLSAYGYCACGRGVYWIGLDRVELRWRLRMGWVIGGKRDGRRGEIGGEGKRGSRKDGKEKRGGKEV